MLKSWEDQPVILTPQLSKRLRAALSNPISFMFSVVPSSREMVAGALIPISRLAVAILCKYLRNLPSPSAWQKKPTSKLIKVLPKQEILAISDHLFLQPLKLTTKWGSSTDCVSAQSSPQDCATFSSGCYGCKDQVRLQDAPANARVQ